MIKEKAKALADPLGTDFKASVGWLQLFMKRKNLSLRKKTSVCPKTLPFLNLSPTLCTLEDYKYPYIVFKGKGTRLIKELQKIPGVVVKFSANGWMNDGLMKDYLNWLFFV